MEVTSQNFKEALQKVKENLKEADFISFDGEFTGLGFGRSFGEKLFNPNDLDTPEERYKKAKKVVREYGIIQFGVTIFRFCSEKRQYFSSTFCFFLSGNPSGSYRYDTSSMTFLAENQFDFNKLFFEGLSFLSLNDEANAREERVEKLLEERCPYSPVMVKDEKSKKFVKEACERISKLSSSDSTCVFLFNSMTGFHRKILYNNVAPQFPNCKMKSNKARDLVVTYFETEEDKLQAQDEDWEAELNTRIGFCHVVKAILEADLPLVGHNCFFDLLHFVDKFLAPLPDTLQEFKSLVLDNMPPIYDTKLIAADPPFSANIMNTALRALYDDLVSNYSPPEFELEGTCASYKIAAEGQYHDGGYDAFMTGVCFVTMVKHLERANWKTIKSPLCSKLLAPYLNRLNLNGSYDIPFLDLLKKDVLPDRSYIYCVACPTEFTHLDVRKLFSNLKAFKTVWVNSVSLYVIPQDDNDVMQAKTLLEGIRAICPSNVFVSMYRNNNKDTARPSNGRKNVQQEPAVVIVLDDDSNDSIPATAAAAASTCTAITPSTTSSSVQKTSSAAFKRKSNDSSTSPASVSTEGKDGGKIIKRLKSVGSEQLSNMTLESPIVEDVGEAVRQSIKDAIAARGDFYVPFNL